jgi:hypothetical protein
VRKRQSLFGGQRFHGGNLPQRQVRLAKIQVQLASERKSQKQAQRVSDPLGQSHRFIAAC